LISNSQDGYSSNPQKGSKENSLSMQDKLNLEESGSKADQGSKKKSKFPITSYEGISKDYLENTNLYIDTYKKLKYKGFSYSVNDTLLVKNELDPNNDYICKLIKIIRPIKLEPDKILSFLEVQW